MSSEERVVIGGTRVSMRDEPARARLVRARRVLRADGHVVALAGRGEDARPVVAWIPRHLSVVFEGHHAYPLALLGVLPDEEAARSWLERTAVSVHFCDNLIKNALACFGDVPESTVRDDPRAAFWNSGFTTVYERDANVRARTFVDVRTAKIMTVADLIGRIVDAEKSYAHTTALSDVRRLVRALVLDNMGITAE